MPNLIVIFGPGALEREVCEFAGGRPLGEQIDDLALALQIDGALAVLPGATLALYRRRGGAYERLRRDQSPDEIRLRGGAELFLADVLSPWMDLPASRAPTPQPAAGPACRVTLAEGCAVTVSGPLVQLGRAWLLEQLRAAGRDDRDHRLRFVSRACHCELLQHGAGWALRPAKETWLDGRPLAPGALAPLTPAPARVLLGEGGWPLIVQPRS